MQMDEQMDGWLRDYHNLSDAWITKFSLIPMVLCCVCFVRASAPLLMNGHRVAVQKQQQQIP